MSTFSDEEIDKLQAILSEIPDYFDDIEEVVCPHCGEGMGLSSDDLLYDESGYPMECDNCKKDFELYPSMTWSWSTDKGGES